MEFGLKAAMNNMDSTAKTGLLQLENTQSVQTSKAPFSECPYKAETCGSRF